MEPVLIKKPDFWHLVISGHFDDVEIALQAIKKNQREAWGNRKPEWKSDDDEAEASVKLRWIDITMVRLVNSILNSDHPDIHIKINKGAYFNDNTNTNYSR